MFRCRYVAWQGFCGGAVDAIANAAITVVHGAVVAPWMQVGGVFVVAIAYSSKEVSELLGYYCRMCTRMSEPARNAHPNMHMNREQSMDEKKIRVPCYSDRVTC